MVTVPAPVPVFAPVIPAGDDGLPGTVAVADVTLTIYSAVLPSSAVTVYVTGLVKSLDVTPLFLLNSSYFQFGSGTNAKSRNQIGESTAVDL